jgi:hypothetical protein
MTYNIPLNGDRDELGIYIDTILPNMNIQDQIKAIENYMNETAMTNVSFIREGDTDCIMMCPDNLSLAVQWKIGHNLENAKNNINIVRNHFNKIGAEHEIIKYDTRSRSCQKCGKTDNIKMCGRCRNVFYCSVKCQRSDWKNHKINCKKL